MKSYSLLEPKIKKYIFDKNWSELKPIQTVAIREILNNNSNYILSSRTASGKTEAVFLPLLSLIEKNKENDKSVIIYVSPLKSLLNDQFVRLEELASYLSIRVTKWHGESSRAKKSHFLNNPSGILLITPESLEGIITNRGIAATNIKSKVKYVIVDEIHYFLSSDRGIHLQSLLSRMNTGRKGIRYFGLSATLGTDSASIKTIKAFFKNNSETQIINDSTHNNIHIKFKYFDDSKHSNIELIKDIYKESNNKKCLIFPNRRSKVEEIAFQLKKMGYENRSNVFAHHGSISKDIREYIEKFAKESSYESFSVVCTSTLELGIDIGSIDTAIQVNSCYSVESLSQRIGRSGRRSGNINAVVYNTNTKDLLLSVSVRELLRKGYTEPKEINSKPINILFHQILAILKENNGLNIQELLSFISENWAFSDIDREIVKELLVFMIQGNFLEALDDELIIGYMAEKIINSKDFYSMFVSSPMFSVMNNGKKIGEIDPIKKSDYHQYKNHNIILASLLWRITEIDFNSSSVFVVKAKDGKPPLYSGSGVIIHDDVFKEIKNVLFSGTNYNYLDPEAKAALHSERLVFKDLHEKNISKLIPVLVNTNCDAYLFLGTKQQNTMNILFPPGEGTITFKQNILTFPKGLSKKNILDNIYEKIEQNLLEETIQKKISESNSEFGIKWSNYLPINMRVELYLSKYTDIEGLLSKLNNSDFAFSG